MSAPSVSLPSPARQRTACRCRAATGNRGHRARDCDVGARQHHRQHRAASIARDFGATPAASIWVVNAYQLAILVVLLPLASLGEVVGYRRVSQAGLAVFTLASLACACAPTLLTLSIARVIQGLGAAGIMSVSAALVRFTYPQRYLGRAVASTRFVVATSAALGPTIASAVLAVAQWRWLFGINVPLGVITILIAIRALPETERIARPLNYAGAALYAGTFGLLLSGLQSLAHHAATPLALLQIGCGCALGGCSHGTSCRVPRRSFLSTCCASAFFPCHWRPRVFVHGADDGAGRAAVRDSAPAVT